MADRIEIVEVSPRDGLQNEREVVSTAAKVRLVEDLVAAGVRRMEVTSFVHPQRVPQMADAEQVMAAVPRRDDVSYIGLVLNHRGAVRAAAAGVDEINYVVPATDTFGQRNQGVTTRRALDALGPISTVAREHGAELSVTIAVAFGCPYEGEVPTDRVSEVAREVMAAGVDELALADTLGSAVPREVTERVQAVQGLSAPLRPAPVRDPPHRSRQRAGGDRGRGDRARCQRRGPRRMPLRAGRGRERRHRGPRVDAGPQRLRHRARRARDRRGRPPGLHLHRSRAALRRRPGRRVPRGGGPGPLIRHH